MKVSEELFLLALDPNELRTLLAIRHLAGAKTTVDATMEELGELTKLGRTSLSKAVSGLSNAGFISVYRTKRNLGKYFINRYTLLPCSPQRTSTHGQGDSNSNTVDKLNKLNNSTLYDSDSHTKGKSYKEVLVPVQRWKGEDTTGDDNIGGFGLFEDEKPAVVKHRLSTDARDPKTRHRRPQEEWTPADIAVEFSAQLTRKFPLLPGLLKTSNLRGALAKNRKQFGITALIELEILKMFMGDARLIANAEEQPHLLYKKYLRMFTTHMDKALVALGMPTRKQLVEDAPVFEERQEFVYAADGRSFTNTIPGRKSLERHEQKLKEQNV